MLTHPHVGKGVRVFSVAKLTRCPHTHPGKNKFNLSVCLNKLTKNDKFSNKCELEFISGSWLAH